MRTSAPGAAAAIPAGDRERAADAAIARVLEAERDARAAVAECARQAEQELQRARERARRIAERGAARAAAVQRAIERRIAARLASIAERRARLDADAGGAPQPRALAEAAAQLALELTAATADRAPGHTP